MLAKGKILFSAKVRRHTTGTKAMRSMRQILVLNRWRKHPIYAIKLVIGDLGTYAGLATNKFSQVLDNGDSPIPGLYAVGNDIASIMGGNYPGAGITLGPALTFGHIAGCHLAGAATGSQAPQSADARRVTSVDHDGIIAMGEVA